MCYVKIIPHCLFSYLAVLHIHIYRMSKCDEFIDYICIYHVIFIDSFHNYSTYCSLAVILALSVFDYLRETLKNLPVYLWQSLGVRIYYKKHQNKFKALPESFIALCKPPAVHSLRHVCITSTLYKAVIIINKLYPDEVWINETGRHHQHQRFCYDILPVNIVQEFHGPLLFHRLIYIWDLIICFLIL